MIASRKRAHITKKSRTKRWGVHKSRIQRPPSTAVIQRAQQLEIPYALLMVDSGDLQDLQERPTVVRAAAILAEVAENAPRDRVFAAAVYLLFQMDNDAERAVALDKMMRTLAPTPPVSSGVGLFT